MEAASGVTGTQTTKERRSRATHLRREDGVLKTDGAVEVEVEVDGQMLLGILRTLLQKTLEAGVGVHCQGDLMTPQTLIPTRRTTGVQEQVGMELLQVGIFRAAVNGDNLLAKAIQRTKGKKQTTSGCVHHRLR